MRKTLFHALLLTSLCLGLAGLTLALSGCSSVAKSLNIENPRYSIRDIRPRVSIGIPLSQSSIDFDFLLGVDNPNSVRLRLDRVDFDLLVNGNRVLTSMSDQRIDIPARGVGDVRLRSRVRYEDLRTMFREVSDVIEGNRARYELRGNAYYDTPIGQMKFPVTVFSTGDDRDRR